MDIKNKTYKKKTKKTSSNSRRTTIKNTRTKSKKTLPYAVGKDKVQNRLNKKNYEAYQAFFDCRDKHCGDIEKKVEANGGDEYRQKLENKCPEQDFSDDLECKKSKCKKHMKCVHDYFKNSKYGKLQEKFKKCIVKNCSLKEKEMNEAADNMENYFIKNIKKEEETEGKKKKFFFGLF